MSALSISVKVLVESLKGGLRASKDCNHIHECVHCLDYVLRYGRYSRGLNPDYKAMQAEVEVLREELRVLRLGITPLILPGAKAC